MVCKYSSSMRLLLFAIILNSISCGSAKNNENPIDSPESIVTSSEVPPGHVQIALDKIREQFDSYDLCLREDACEIVDVSFEVKPVTSTATSRDIVLVIDAGQSLSAAARYHSRVLNWFSVESGQLKGISPSFKMPKQAKIIFRDILDSSPTPISQRYTAAIYREFASRFYSEISQGVIGSHMNRVFNILAEYSPESLFVLMNLDNQEPFGVDLICNMDPNNTQNLKNRVDSFVSKLTQLINQYGIRFVNMSLGYSLRQSEQVFDLNCPANKSIEKVKAHNDLFRDLLRKIERIKGLTVVQAGVGSTNSLTLDNPEFASDCDSKASRIRVGFISDPNSSISSFGRYAGTETPYPRDRINEWTKNAWQCLDVIVNSGSRYDVSRESNEEGTVPFKYSLFGIDFRTESEMTTSWSAPLFLSHVLYMKGLHDFKPEQLNSNSLLDLVTGDRPKTHKVIDPLLNREFSNFDHQRQN